MYCWDCGQNKKGWIKGRLFSWYFNNLDHMKTLSSVLFLHGCVSKTSFGRSPTPVQVLCYWWPWKLRKLLKIYLDGKCRTLLSSAGESPKSSLLQGQSACCTSDIVKENTPLNGLSEKKSLKEIFTRLNFSRSIFEKDEPMELTISNVHVDLYNL